MSRRRRKRAPRKKKTGGRAKSPSPAPREPHQGIARSADEAVAEPVASLPESAEAQVQVTHTRSIEVSAGPLPHPGFFQAYENTLPGAAHRILAMAETQQEHRHEQQAARLRSDESREARGQWIALAVVVTGIVAGTTLVLSDKSIEGVATALGAIGGVASLFVWSRRPRSGVPPVGSPHTAEQMARPPTPPE